MAVKLPISTFFLLFAIVSCAPPESHDSAPIPDADSVSVPAADSIVPEPDEAGSGDGSTDMAPPAPKPSKGSFNTDQSGTPLAQMLMQFTWSAELDVEQPPESKLNLRFDREGRVSGSTGCNTFLGTYTLQGNQVSFSVQTLTKRACADELESRFLEALRQTRSMVQNEEGITLSNGQSKVVLQLRTSD